MVNLPEPTVERNSTQPCFTIYSCYICIMTFWYEHKKRTPNSRLNKKNHNY